MTLDYVLVKFQVGGKGVPLINRTHFCLNFVSLKEQNFKACGQPKFCWWILTSML